MTTPAFKAVGLCAHYSPQGDWAFRFALDLARSQRVQLNIFHFLADPYAEEEAAATGLAEPEREQAVIERERELRFYYEDKLGDYLEAGFRLCEGEGWTELHHCMCKQEFQLLVLPYPSDDAHFAGRPLTAFASAFACPVVLVGPTRPDEYHLNSPAVFLADKLPLGGSRWSPLDASGRAESPA